MSLLLDPSIVVMRTTTVIAFAVLLCALVETVTVKHSCRGWPFVRDVSSMTLRPEILDAGYTTSVGPQEAAGNATDVLLFLVVEEQLPLNEADQELTMTVLIDLRWNDSRLALPPECKNMSGDGVADDDDDDGCDGALKQKFHISAVEGQLWKPSFKIVNLMRVSDRHVLFDPRVSMVDGCNGVVQVTTSLKLSISCMLDFTLYPFDSQACDLILVVPFYAHTFTDRVRLKWRLPPKIITRDPPIQIDSHDGGVQQSGNWERHVDYEVRVSDCLDDCADNFLAINFFFIRARLGYFVQTLIPSLLMVIASVGSLWVPRDQVPGRMTLAITTTLTLMSMIGAVFESAPKTAYLKAIDIWLTSCFSVTFLNLLEFCVVLALTKSKDRDRDGPDDKGVVTNGKVRVALLLESWCKVLIPLLFACFCIIFYIHVTAETKRTQRPNMTRFPILTHAAHF